MRTSALSRLLLAAVVAVMSGAGAAVRGQESPRGQRLVRQLANRKTRNKAYCQLLALGLHHRPLPYRDECHPVTQVVDAPQPSGPPLHLVFVDSGFPITRAPHRQNAAGAFSIFDDAGFIIPVFGGANLIEQDSELFTYAPDGRKAVGHVYGCVVDRADQSVVQVLHIVPTAPEQTPALNVLLGPPLVGPDDECEGYFWTWRAKDINGDGSPEIEIGPRLDNDDRFDPVATFRWSTAEGRYVGPAGSPPEGFQVFTRDTAKSTQQQFVAYWRNHVAERLGKRRYQCEKGEAASGGTP
jgi:hypothetical protein